MKSKNEKWKMRSEKWKMKNEKWKMINEKWNEYWRIMRNEKKQNFKKKRSRIEPHAILRTSPSHQPYSLQKLLYYYVSTDTKNNIHCERSRLNWVNVEPERIHCSEQSSQKSRRTLNLALEWDFNQFWVCSQEKLNFLAHFGSPHPDLAIPTSLPG